MSIRLRFTLLYNTILLITLAVFGVTLYVIQASVTYDALKNDVLHSSDKFKPDMLTGITTTGTLPAPDGQRPPMPFESISGDPAFQNLPEREVVRVLDAAGNLVASPFGRTEDALPLSAEGLAALNSQGDWWETGDYQDQAMLIYSRPVSVDGQMTYIVQIARSLTERNRTLQTLATALIAASLVTILIALGIGWVLSGVMLEPIQRITQTARAIGDERDFTRRVAYTGPQDEVGQLAGTFNAMLARLQDAYQQAANALEMQRNFVGDVSHELRTPLTTLRGNIGLLRRTPAIPADEQADILNDMVDESDRLIRLVNKLLILARADAGRSLAKESIAVLPLLEETCRQAHPIDPERVIAIDAPAEIAVLGDRDALKQVLLILLDNALKHSSGGIEVAGARAKNRVVLRVEDHGEGLSAEQLARVFDRFYRGEDSAAIPGFGLGLPIAKALVEGQGGTIHMESVPGAGSVVTVNLPRG